MREVLQSSKKRNRINLSIGTGFSPFFCNQFRGFSQNQYSEQILNQAKYIEIYFSLFELQQMHSKVLLR